MKKKIIVIIFLFILSLAGLTVYLNNVFLPQKIKSLIIDNLQQATRKKASLGALQFSIFKGLVLKNLNIYEGEKSVVNVKEASCTFLLLPLLQRKIIIPKVKVKQAEISISPVFTKTIENLNVYLNYQLPNSINFRLKGQIAASPLIKITAAGEYKIPERFFTVKVSLQDLSPKEFSPYLKAAGVDISEGLINAKADIEYGIQENLLKFSGNATISKAGLSGLKLIGAIDNINGELSFDNSGVRSDRLNADILGIPAVAQFKLQDFKNQSLDINIAAQLSLDTAQAILRDKFKVILPASVKGNASLLLNIQGKAPIQENLQANGYLDFISAFVKPDKFPYPLEDISGRVNFSQDGLRWEDVNFKYSGASYKTSGSLTGFKSPEVELALKSNDLFLDSGFIVNKGLVSLVKLEGRYLNSQFSVSGKLDASVPQGPVADLKGDLDIEAQDLKSLFAKFKNQLEQTEAQGRVNAQFSFNGNINDFKSCSLQAKLSTHKLSIYGLKLESLSLDYFQENGMAEIPLMQLSFYDGAAKISAKINLSSKNIPYLVTLDLQGLNLEKLKMDTGAKNEDIAGRLSSQLKLNGFYADISTLSGAGNIFIAEGRLWQLNLFKGLGSLVFARDFADIIFKEGSCDFLIKDRQILSENITLKSSIADISGRARIGFDSSLDASLNVKILDEMAPLSGGFKDLTTAIMGEAGRFGIIKIGGTLKEPKYKFKPAVGDIIKGLKDIILGK